MSRRLEWTIPRISSRNPWMVSCCENTALHWRWSSPTKKNKEGFNIGVISKGRKEIKDEPNSMICDIAKELNAKVWIREDMGTYCLRRSNRSGPRWCNVLAGITVDNDTQQVIRIEGKEDLDSQVSYHKQWVKPRNTCTALVYRAGVGEEELKRSRMRTILSKSDGAIFGSGVSVASWLRGSLENSP